MTRRKLLWAALLALPLAVAGVVYGQALSQRRHQASAQSESYICPVTGEELSCPLCCPYSQQK